MADLKNKQIRDSYMDVLTKGTGTAIEDGDGNAFIGAIVNNLTSTATNAPLSANQGRVLAKELTTDYDMWYLTTQFSGNALPITDNLARNNKIASFKKGDGMSQASGIFTFPQTGLWEIKFVAHKFLTQNESSRFVSNRIEITLNNSVYNIVTEGFGNLYPENANVPTTVISDYTFNVTDVDNQKVRFGTSSDNANVVTSDPNGDSIRTYMTFKRIGDSV